MSSYMIDWFIYTANLSNVNEFRDVRHLSRPACIQHITLSYGYLITSNNIHIM